MKKIVKIKGYERIILVLQILAFLPALSGTVYFIGNIIDAVNSTLLFSENFDIASLGWFFGGLLLSAVINGLIGFVINLILHFNPTLGDISDRVMSKLHKALYIVRLLFVASFATFWAIGILLYTLIGAENTFDILNIAMFFVGVGVCAACYGYTLYGFLSLRDNNASLLKIETVSTVIFVIAWIGFAAIMGTLTIEDTLLRPVYARQIYSDAEVFAISVFLFGPLIYVAQKHLLRLIFKLVTRKKQ